MIKPDRTAQISSAWRSIREKALRSFKEGEIEHWLVPEQFGGAFVFDAKFTEGQVWAVECEGELVWLAVPPPGGGIRADEIDFDNLDP